MPAEYFEAKARAALDQLGASLAHATALAEWAAEAKNRAENAQPGDAKPAGVIVTRSGRIIAETRRNLQPSSDTIPEPTWTTGPTYVARDTCTVKIESTTLDRAIGEIRRTVGEDVAHISLVDLAYGSGAAIRNQTQKNAATPRLSGEEIRHIRATLGFSGVKLAAELGVRPDTLNKWEKDADPAPYGLRRDLAQITRNQSMDLQALARRLSQA